MTTISTIPPRSSSLLYKMKSFTISKQDLSINMKVFNGQRRRTRLPMCLRPRKNMYQLFLLGLLLFVFTLVLNHSLKFSAASTEKGGIGSVFAFKNTRLRMRWQRLVDQTPKPDKQSDDWIARQGMLYKHIREMRNFRKLLSVRNDEEVLKTVEKGLKPIEQNAYSFMKEDTELKEVPISGLDTLLEIPLCGRYTRGIVVVAGDLQYRLLLHMLASLRHVLNSTMPVEVFHKGDGDLSPDQQKALKDFGGVVTKDITNTTYFDDKEIDLKNATYALKPYALLASEFEEPMLCDADTVFLQDPHNFYENEGYQNTGTLFFHDREFRGMGLRKWLIGQFFSTGQTPSKYLQESAWWNHQYDGNVQDSGVVVINKRRDDVVLSLMFAAWLNGKEQRQHLEKMMWGEKETYWLAYELTNQNYTFTPKNAGGMGKLINDIPDAHNATRNVTGLRIDNMVHFDQALKPLWANGGLLQSKNWPESPFLEVDTLGVDGVWSYSKPFWRYVDAKWTKVPEIGEIIGKMTKIAHEMDEKYKPKNNGYVEYTEKQSSGYLKYLSSLIGVMKAS